MCPDVTSANGGDKGVSRRAVYTTHVGLCKKVCRSKDVPHFDGQVAIQTDDELFSLCKDGIFFSERSFSVVVSNLLDVHSIRRRRSGIVVGTSTYDTRPNEFSLSGWCRRLSGCPVSVCLAWRWGIECCHRGRRRLIRVSLM